MLKIMTEMTTRSNYIDKARFHIVHFGDGSRCFVYSAPAGWAGTQNRGPGWLYPRDSFTKKRRRRRFDFANILHEEPCLSEMCGLG